MHRDLKLANILIHFPSLTKEEQLKPDFDLKEFIRSIEIVPGRAKQCTPIEVKIADLGFARKLHDGDVARSYLGTPLIMAPEVLDGCAYDHSADVWSLGCVFYETLTGFPAFTGMNKADLIENITRGTYYFPKTCKLSIAGLSFLHACLQYEYLKRPNLQELIKHQYLKEGTVEVENDLFLSFVPESRLF